jgi:hypothetical protein
MWSHSADSSSPGCIDSGNINGTIFCVIIIKRIDKRIPPPPPIMVLHQLAAHDVNKNWN